MIGEPKIGEKKLTAVERQVRYNVGLKHKLDALGDCICVMERKMMYEFELLHKKLEEKNEN